MLNRRQKFLLHHYARAAQIPEPIYRSTLRHTAGCSSAADPDFSQSGFERAMAALETSLFQRADLGRCPDPLGADRYITREYYWRNRLPRSGCINSRQAHRMRELWTRLQNYLPDEHRNLDYLGRIIRKATGRTEVGLTALTAPQAAALIDALTDRLSFAITGHKHHTSDPLLDANAPMEGEAPSEPLLDAKAPMEGEAPSEPLTQPVLSNPVPF